MSSDLLQVNKAVYYRPAPKLQPGVYRASQPVAKVTYSSVYDSNDLMRPKVSCLLKTNRVNM